MKKAFGVTVARRQLTRTFTHAARRSLDRLDPVNPAQSYFQVFELPLKYGLHLPSLKKSFLELQRKVHPDAYAQAGEEQEGRARLWSELVNRAYKTLSSPLERAEYMLSMKNQEVQESDSIDDPELLMLMMEAHEALEEAGNQTQVDALRAENKEKLESVVREINQAFEADDIDQAKDLTIKLRYYSNIENACKDWTEGKPVRLTH